MVFPELRDILCPDLVPPALPADPADCAVSFQVLIGPVGGEGSDAFSFTVATPSRLLHSADARWGRGYLIVERFDWDVVVEAVARLLACCGRPTWEEVVQQLNHELQWALDNRAEYRDPEGGSA